MHVVDKPEVLNTGTNDWDEEEVTPIPAPAPEKKGPELSTVMVNGGGSPSPASSNGKKVSRTNGALNGDKGMDAVNTAARSMQSDAPACSTCGHITIRSGTCYKCLNCGTSMGCS